MRNEVDPMKTETATKFERDDILIGVRGRKRGRLAKVQYVETWHTDERERYRIRHEGHGELRERHARPIGSFISLPLGKRAMSASTLTDSVERDFVRLDLSALRDVVARADRLYRRAVSAGPIGNSRSAWRFRCRIERAARNVLLSTVEG